MARPRKAPVEEVETEVEVQKSGEFEGIKIPPDYVDYPDSWKRAYKRAIDKGTMPKGAALYADAHGHEEMFGGEGEE